MFLTKAADALLRRLVPQIEAAAAPVCPCAPVDTRCINHVLWRYAYWMQLDYYHQCSIKGAVCRRDVLGSC